MSSAKKCGRGRFVQSKSGFRKACRLWQFRLADTSSLQQMICSAGRKLLYRQHAKRKSQKNSPKALYSQRGSFTMHFLGQASAQSPQEVHLE